jgi:hypothetical protein
MSLVFTVSVLVRFHNPPIRIPCAGGWGTRGLEPAGANAANQQTRMPTESDKRRPTWLQHAHEALDRAVWAASG